MWDWLLDLPGIGAVISGVAALIAAYYSARNAKELHPNHGSSLRDAVDKLSSKVHEMDERQTDFQGEFQAVKDAILKSHALIDKRIDALENSKC